MTSIARMAVTFYADRGDQSENIVLTITPPAGKPVTSAEAKVYTSCNMSDPGCVEDICNQSSALSEAVLFHLQAAAWEIANYGD